MVRPLVILALFVAAAAANCRPGKWCKELSEAENYAKLQREGYWDRRLTYHENRNVIEKGSHKCSWLCCGYPFWAFWFYTKDSTKRCRKYCKKMGMNKVHDYPHADWELNPEISCPTHDSREKMVPPWDPDYNGDYWMRVKKGIFNDPILYLELGPVEGNDHVYQTGIWRPVETTVSKQGGIWRPPMEARGDGGGEGGVEGDDLQS